jgi:hypothetical protein
MPSASIEQVEFRCEKFLSCLRRFRKKAEPAQELSQSGLPRGSDGDLPPSPGYGEPGKARRSLWFSMPSRSLEERFPPGAVGGVPVDGRIETFLEIVERFPVQLAVRK